MTEPLRIIMHVRVTTVGGVLTRHSYEVPDEDAEYNEFMEQMVDRLLNAVEEEDDDGEKVTSLYLENPTIIYKARNIVSVELEYEGPKDVDERMRRTNERLGFLRG